MPWLSGHNGNGTALFSSYTPKERMALPSNACVIGSGPNGLAAAIVLAQAGVHVDVFEAEALAGGGARTMELTLPGFMHDVGSAVHPLAAGSPFFSSLPLDRYGLEWIQPPVPLAHPLDDGTAVLLERDMEQMVREIGDDGEAWKKLVSPFVDHWDDLIPAILAPLKFPPQQPLLMARFGISAIASAEILSNMRFHAERMKALFAGLAAHSFLSLEEPLSASFGIVLGAAAHAVGWPIPCGGSQAITSALTAHLETLGGTLTTSRRIYNLNELGDYDLIMCDVTPKQLLQMSDGRFSESDRTAFTNYRYGAGVFKVDYALSKPLPWAAADCLRAGTVHLGGTFDEVSASEKAVRKGEEAERPFVLLSQPSLFDPSRAPEGMHTAWAYCHVPNGSEVDMLEAIERQIDRFAPGFRHNVLGRWISGPAHLQSMNANLIGGDINGGVLDFKQFLFRPTRRHYGTSSRNVYLCSSSTPPGGGVHGMCGYHAAKMALREAEG